MGSHFDYLLDRIREAPFETEPFKHLYLRDFLNPEDFDRIVNSQQIRLPDAADTPELFSELADAGYKVIGFPGCITSEKEYLDWQEGKAAKKVHGATEAFGIVYRLHDRRDPVLDELDAFFSSQALRQALLDKFGIAGKVTMDGGIQKYLHGYEISPHCDIRRKALTWMLNINPGENAEQHEYHTHYLKLKPEWEFVETFWAGNQDVDRDWLPWDWCDTIRRQRENNSIVFFSPSDDTMHAVKANYDHLRTQRTQLYGNLWYDDVPRRKVDYKHFEALKTGEVVRPSLVDALKASPVGDVVRSLKGMVKPAGGKIDNIRNIDV